MWPPTTGHSLIVGRSGKNIAGGSSIVYDSSSKLVIGLPKRGKGVVVEKNIYLPLGFIHLKVIMKNIGVDICCAYLEIYCSCCSVHFIFRRCLLQLACTFVLMIGCGVALNLCSSDFFFFLLLFDIG